MQKNPGRRGEIALTRFALADWLQAERELREESIHELRRLADALKGEES